MLSYTSCFNLSTILYYTWFSYCTRCTLNPRVNERLNNVWGRKAGFCLQLCKWRDKESGLIENTFLRLHLSYSDLGNHVRMIGLRHYKHADISKKIKKIGNSMKLVIFWKELIKTTLVGIHNALQDNLDHVERNAFEFSKWFCKIPLYSNMYTIIL